MRRDDDDDDDDELRRASLDIWTSLGRTRIPTLSSVDGVRRAKKMARVRAYAPRIFEDLRTSVFGIDGDRGEDDDDEDDPNPNKHYLGSILRSGPFVSFQSNSRGAERSGPSVQLMKTHSVSYVCIFSPTTRPRLARLRQ